jgi:hypothetical protein
VAIRAVVDTSSLVQPTLRGDLYHAAQLGLFTPIWSPWIIAELNRVLTWHWIKARTGGDLSRANERRCAEMAKTMMALLLPSFELAAPLPPYPAVWETLTDEWDQPIWAAAILSGAQYVISENSHDYPPRQDDGCHRYNGIEYLSGTAFLRLLTGE